MKILVILTILAVLFLTTESREYKYHLTLKPNVFDVYWSVNTTKLFDAYIETFYFKFVAKTTGWAALGWTKTPEGKYMIQYDIALGGVRNGNDEYLTDYYSSTLGKPDLDPSSSNNNLQSLVLTNATEADGFTTIEFNRSANTFDNANDVPLENGTKMWLMWAIAPTDATNPTTFVKHSDKGYTKVAYNMFTGEQFGVSTTTSKPSGTGATIPAVASTEPSTTSKQSGTGTTIPSVASTVPSNTTSKPSGTGATTPSVAINIISSILVVVLLRLSNC